MVRLHNFVSEHIDSVVAQLSSSMDQNSISDYMVQEGTPCAEVWEAAHSASGGIQKDKTTWMKDHEEAFGGLRLRRPSEEQLLRLVEHWTPLSQRMFRAMRLRSQEVVYYYIAKAAHDGVPLRGFTMDVSQSLSFKTTAEGGKITCLTGKGEPFHITDHYTETPLFDSQVLPLLSTGAQATFDKNKPKLVNRMLLVPECLLLQGISAKDFPALNDVEEALGRRLGGNAFNGPCFIGHLTSLLVVAGMYMIAARELAP